MTNAHQLFNQAKNSIPGGVNSPVRAFKGVGGDPIFIDHAQGAYLFDSEGKKYIDYVGSWGPMVLGHAHPEVIKAVADALPNGLSFGAPTALETQMAEKICQLMPSIELVRMVSSGTEATMSAIRLARGYTGRDKIVKFDGCYHGHSDSLLVKAGSGALTFGEPSSLGVPAALAALTITLDFNDLCQVEACFKEVGEQVACIIVEPIAGNMNCIPPKAGYLEGLRKICDQYGTVLIFDEVMTGFRTALGGAQSIYKVQPDLTTLGKVIGGGMPVGAFGGKKEIMEYISPLGAVYQAGTLSGNPIAMTAGLKNLELIAEDGFFEALAIKTKTLVDGLCSAAHAKNIGLTSNQIGGMFGLFFTDQAEVTNLKESAACDQERFKNFFHLMLEAGIYLAPSSFEAGFVSAAHTDQDIQQTIEIATKIFKLL